MVTKKLIGHCGVDAGLIYIVDPCYIKSQPLVADGERWQDFCNEFYKGDSGRKNEGTHAKEMCNGVVTNTRWGDGNYPVYAIQNKQGETLRIVIEF